MHPTVDRIVGRNLRRLREERGVSQHELAAQASIDADDVAGFEDDGVRVPPQVMLALATCLGVSISAFFEGFVVGAPEKPPMAVKLH
jgi:transcriptional regulator with XRE-family HTH domain